MLFVKLFLSKTGRLLLRQEQSRGSGGQLQTGKILP